MAERRMSGRIAPAAALALGIGLAAAAPALANDFPTEARVDYVIGCMAANGQSRLVMQKCACSVDYIAERMPYERYVTVETIKRMMDVPGERTSMFRDSQFASDVLDEFRQLQVQADLACF